MQLAITTLMRRWLALGSLVLLSVFVMLWYKGHLSPTPYKPWDLRTHMAPPHLAIVLPKRASESISWALSLSPTWETYAYSTSDSPQEPWLPLPIYPNRGRETLTYLTFIIDNYDSLPSATAFVHAAGTQWHNDLLGASTGDLLMHLDLENVQKKGYLNLRCSHEPGCPLSVLPLNPTEIDIKDNGTRAHFASIYTELFNVSKEEVPEHIGGVCCAQFVVSRDRIRARPKNDYERMRRWAMESEWDDYSVGWVMEKVWHVVFGMESVHCPSFEQCRCALVGWCEKKMPKELRPYVLGAHPWLGSRLGRLYGNDYAAGDWF